MSPLDQQSHELHEMFLSLSKVGFTEKQALFIVSMALISIDYSSDPDDEDEEEFVITLSEDTHPSNKEVERQPTEEEEAPPSEEEDSSE